MTSANLAATLCASACQQAVALTNHMQGCLDVPARVAMEACLCASHAVDVVNGVPGDFYVSALVLATDMAHRTVNNMRVAYAEMDETDKAKVRKYAKANGYDVKVLFG